MTYEQDVFFTICRIEDDPDAADEQWEREYNLWALVRIYEDANCPYGGFDYDLLSLCHADGKKLPDGFVLSAEEHETLFYSIDAGTPPFRIMGHYCGAVL